MSQKPPDQMTLLVLKSTNQVLAALTRAAVPDSAKTKGDETDEQKAKNQTAELDVLVGVRLTVRDLRVTSTIPTLIEEGISFSANDLAAVTVDLDPKVLIGPSLYSLDSKTKPQLGLDPSTLIFTASVTSITLELPNAATEDTGFWIEIYEKGKFQQLQIVSGTIEKSSPFPGNQKVSKSIQLAPGKTYQFLTFVQGYQPLVYEKAL